MPGLQDWMAEMFSDEPDPELQRFMRDPSTNRRAAVGLPLRRSNALPPRPFGNQPPMGRVNPRPQVRMSELAGHEYPFPGREPMVADSRVVRLPNANAPMDPFSLPAAPRGMLRADRLPTDREAYRDPVTGSAGRPGFAPKDATFEIDPAWTARNPASTAEAHYSYRRQPNGSAIRTSEVTFDPVQEAPPSARRPIKRQSMAEIENDAWNAALARVQADRGRANEDGPAWRRHAPGLGAPNYALSRRR